MNVTFWDLLPNQASLMVEGKAHLRFSTLPYLTASSSRSLKTNPGVRIQLLTSVPSSSALVHIQQSSHSTARDHHVPYLPESAYDVGLTLPFDADAYELARTTPLAAPDPMEYLYLQEAPTAMMEYETEEGRFAPAPLQVENGVAVMEESVELGVPDVITQA